MSNPGWPDHKKKKSSLSSPLHTIPFSDPTPPNPNNAQRRHLSMKNLLKKLHIVPDQPPQSPPSGSGIPRWFSSVTGKTPLVGEVEGKKGSSALEEEEDQLRLAIELSKEEDPEAVQIEAVKQISFGSSSGRTSPAELLAFSYWNYNVLSFDDKIPDGFYDLYGVSAHPSAEMPSLVDLQEATASNSILCQAVLVNRSGDPDLLKLEQEALRMALQSKCGSADYAERSLVQELANLVSDYMGGAIGKNSNILEAWKSFRMTIRDTVLPLGYVTVGLARHRALMFKVLADSVGLPCQLVKGKVFTGSDDGAMNIVRLGDGREWIVDLMINPGTLVLYKKCNNSSSAFNPSIGDCEISCSSNTSSSFTCSSGKETTDNRLFGYVGTSGSEASTLGELSNEEIYRAKTFSKEPQKKPRDDTGEVNNHAKNLPSQKAPLHDTSAKKNSSTSLARSPSWTEGVSSQVVNKMKVNDVSQYMIEATKENPHLAQKLHDVLLESGVAVPPDLFTEISSEQQQTSTSKALKSSDFMNETRKRETEINQISKGQLPKDHHSPGPPLPYPHNKDIHGKNAQSKPQDCPKPSKALEIYNPSQSGDCSARKQLSQLKMGDNMPVAAAVATAAIVASSMVVAASKSNSDTNVDIPVTTAASAAVVATTTAVNMQKEQLLSYDPLRAIPNCKNAEVAKQKLEKAPQSDEKKTSAHALDGIFEGDAENAIHQEAERSSAKSIGSDSLKSDTSLEDVAEFEIRWEEIALGERVGLGSYGEVYHGDWNGTEVAVKKFLEQDLSGDALDEFRSEVRIMKRLRHPNIVLFMGAVTRVPHLSIITEFLHRGSLFRLIHRPNNQLDERRRMKMALDIARGMNYLHNCSPAIVHRDLKSPNLLVDRNWVVKVCDFGLSRIKHNTFLSSRSTAGTAEWMAPEVLRNEPSDEKCDIYSFGVILWELCTLRQPWGGMNPMQVVGAVGFQQRHLDIPDDMDPVIANIILRCWQLDPKSRPSFSEIMSELKPLQKPATNSPLARQRNTSSSQNC